MVGKEGGADSKEEEVLMCAVEGRGFFLYFTGEWTTGEKGGDGSLLFDKLRKAKKKPFPVSEGERSPLEDKHREGKRAFKKE